MTAPARRPVRRAATLVALALCALTSCGIPTTGVVEAGGPAGGIVPTVRVYFVVDGRLVWVPRRVTPPVDVRSAVESLLQGPTRAEGAKRMTTLLSPPAPAVPTSPADPHLEGADRAVSADAVRVSDDGGRIVVRLSPWVGKLTRLAVDQVVCTAIAAQRVIRPGDEPRPVSVVGGDGRTFRGAAARCPAD
ncbi:hypothetical protein [Streptomyces griseosporeus]|uniref:hypothetical protein n=1 Tax=Streptomyces griseosporeus TaxID=1910 RepID=UPI0036FF95C0